MTQKVLLPNVGLRVYRPRAPVINQGRLQTVSLRRMPLSEEDMERQIRRDMFTLQGGQKLAIPSDSLSRPNVFNHVRLWTVKDGFTVRPGVRWTERQTLWQGKLLRTLRDNVPVIGKNIPYWWYRTVVGHDLHVGIRANLYAQHWHTGWTDPLNIESPSSPLDGEKVSGQGFLERLGWLNGAKVTDAFISETVSELVSATSSEFADYDFQEVGTSNQAENNNDTALIATSSISRVSGTPTDSDPNYQNVGTVTADATETWEEWGLFNNLTSTSLLDRSLTGGQAVNSSDQVQYTYVMTLNPEA